MFLSVIAPVSGRCYHFGINPKENPIRQDAYAAAGVSIDSAVLAKEQIKKLARATFNANVLAGPGFFGGMFEMPSGYKKPVLVSSCDGVGTKLRIASAMGKHMVYR